MTGGTFASNERWFGILNFHGNIVIASGTTIEILSDAIIKLNGHYLVNEGGTIINNGTITPELEIQVISGSTPVDGYFGSIQSAIDYASETQYVKLGPDSFTENINMKAGVGLVGVSQSSTIIDGQVNFNNDDDASLWALKVNKKISVNNSDNVDIGIKAGSSNCYIDMSGSYVFADIESRVSGSYGVYAHHGSFLDFIGELTNKGMAIDLYSNTDAFFEATYFCQNNMDISAGTGCYAETITCEFSSQTEGQSVEGDVYWEEWEYCGYGGSIANRSNGVLSKMITQGDNGSTEVNDFIDAMNLYYSINKKIKQDKKSGKQVKPRDYALEFEGAVGKFKQFLTKYPDSPYAVSALGRIAVIWRVLRKFEVLNGYVQGIAKNPKLGHLRPYALSALVSADIKQNEYVKALELSDQIIDEFPEHEIIVEILYGKGLLYKYHLNVPAKTEEMLLKVVYNNKRYTKQLKEVF